MFDRLSSWLASGIALVAMVWGARYRYQASQLKQEQQRQREKLLDWSEQAAVRQAAAREAAAHRPPPNADGRDDFTDAPK